MLIIAGGILLAVLILGALRHLPTIMGIFVLLVIIGSCSQ